MGGVLSGVRELGLLSSRRRDRRAVATREPSAGFGAHFESGWVIRLRSTSRGASRRAGLVCRWAPRRVTLNPETEAVMVSGVISGDESAAETGHPSKGVRRTEPYASLGT